MDNQPRAWRPWFATTRKDVFDNIITTRKCNKPPAKLKTIYDTLNLKV